MDEEKLFKLYEKLYFHEIKMRDKLTGRQQLSLGILVILLGFLSYMLKSSCTAAFCVSFWIFTFLYLFSFLATALALYNFVRSWHGYTYSYLPTASDTEAYLDKLKETYKPFEEKEQLVDRYFKKYLRDYYVDCSTKNTTNNDRQSQFLDRTNRFIISSIVLATLAFLPFHFGGVRKADAKEKITVELTVPHSCQERSLVMADKPKPPPPPPPPPPRNIRTGGANPPKTKGK